ncbi:MAG: MarR family transcriptional regulator [Armatimonadetes bacterium]|nr:MarR family transcriptional regulator [Armatimonadota bacterium]
MNNALVNNLPDPHGGDEVLQELLRASRVVYRWLGARLEVMGLTPAQLEVLDAVRQSEGLPLSRLRDALCCVGSNVTALVDRMEREGLVERRRDGADRRVVRLFLGPAGREKLARLGDPRECCPETLAALSPAERRRLVSLLRKLVEGLGGACARCDAGGEPRVSADGET